MKKALFSTFFALVSLFAGSQAFALECDGLNLKFVAGNGQVFCSREEAAFNDRNRANMFSGSNVLVMPAQRQPVYIQQQPVLVQQAGQGSGLNNCQFFGGAVGGALGSAAENYRPQATIIGAVVGGLVADRIFCSPQQVPVNQGQTGIVGHNCPVGTTWRTLDWLGHPKHGEELCLPSDEKIREQKAAAKNQEVSSVGQKCLAAGTTWKTLDWPGHPQHGKEACLPSDEKIKEQKAAVKDQEVPSVGQKCLTAGTTWRTLDWPGHPKHGKELCLPSEATIEAQKAAFQNGS